MMSAQWSEDQTRMLIDERRDGSEEYHRTPRRDKRNFWERFAEDINRANNTNYFTGEDCNKKFLALTRAYYTTLAYRKAKAEAEYRERPPTNEESVTGAGDQPPVKAKKRSIIGEHYYEEFSTEFWKEPGSRHSNVGTTPSITPGGPQPSRIARPISSPASIRTASKIPRAIPSPNRSRSTTPATSRSPSGSRPVTPSFSQNAETINIFINYDQE